MKPARRTVLAWARHLLPLAACAWFAFAFGDGTARAQARVPPLTPTQPLGPRRDPPDRLMQPNPAPASPTQSGELPAPPTLYEYYDTLPPFNAPLLPSVPMPPFLYPLSGEPPALPPSPSNPIPALVRPTPVGPAPSVIPEQPNAVPLPAGGLRQAMSEYDRRLGLGSGGSIASVARTLALHDSAEGAAVIDIQTDASGTIREARVVRTTRNPAEWERFARSLRGEAARRIRLPSEARGLWMRMAVEAEERWPSGNRVGHPIRWYPGLIGAGFDVMDLSHRTPVRVVYTTVLSEVWL